MVRSETIQLNQLWRGLTPTSNISFGQNCQWQNKSGTRIFFCFSSIPYVHFIFWNALETRQSLKQILLPPDPHLTKHTSIKSVSVVSPIFLFGKKKNNFTNFTILLSIQKIIIYQLRSLFPTYLDLFCRVTLIWCHLRSLSKAMLSRNIVSEPSEFVSYILSIIYIVTLNLCLSFTKCPNLILA